MEKISLKQLAYKQQIAHLSHAHSQALKTLVENQQPFKLTVNDALSYLELVKTKLGPTEFNEFMQIMKQCKEPNCNAMTTISRLYYLLQSYPELLQGFGMLLPPSFNLQLQTSGRFLIKTVKVQNRIEPSIKCERDENDIQFWRRNIDTSIVKSEGSENAHNAYSSCSEKELNASKEIDDECAINFLSKVKERFQSEPHIFQRFLQLLDSVRKECLGAQTDIETDVFMEICDLFQSHDDLIEEFKAFVPNATYPSKQQEDMDNSTDAMESNFENDDSDLSFDTTPDLSEYIGVNDPSVAPVCKYGSFEEHLFFDKVRQALCHKEVYNNFLRCLMLYNEDVVTRSELLQVATSFLGKSPDLLKEFKDILGFKESGENIEAVPMKIISYENNRLDPEVALDIDYATGGRNGASYRALSKDYKQPKCSGRTPLCKEVLNDTWVSFPSWSEDSTFVTSCKTQYEEMIYRCEDERFELDMAIRTNYYTIQVLENVQKKINKMTPEEKSMFSLDDTLGGTSTVLHQKALHRLYGDKTDELVEGLKRNPVVAVPIILKRLKGKDEEWKEKQKQFNSVWREQIDNYYIKSLDHQGINFKQNDSKSFRSKSLLNEMEMVYAEKKEGNAFHSSSPHFLLEFKEMCVFSDAINLICQYLKKLPGVFRDDRRKIEHLVRHFIPDFFGFPCSSVVEEETEDDDTEQPEGDIDIDNECDVRSGHTSPSESGGFSRDEAFSDQDESNSVEENELSDETDKNSFIEEIDIFDKLDSLPSTNLPYIVFFVNKNWYIFFRQFHILCERLSRLLHESTRKDLSPPKKTEDGISEDEMDKIKESKPSYSELIGKLSQLLSGAIDYTQFEDEARSLFGIHAFVSFTMDKLVLNIVRQLQQVVCDDVSKQCTVLFFQHTKTISDIGCSSPLETSQIETEYFKKVERIMGEEKCFKILWHKKDHTITIELIEEAFENIEDPCEVEKWSNYLDAYVTEDSVCEEILSHAQGLPVFLPRNLRRQQEYWKRKVAYVENLWKTRYSPSFLKSNLPLSFKRKLKPVCSHSSKMSPISSKEKFDENGTSCSESAVNDDAESNSKTDQAIASNDLSHSSIVTKDLDSQLDDSCSSFVRDIKLSVKSDSEKSPVFIEIDSDEDCEPGESEIGVDEEPLMRMDGEEVIEQNSNDDSKIKSECFFEETRKNDISLGISKEDQESMDIDYNSCSSFNSIEKKESSHDTLDSIEENMCFQKKFETGILSVGAFHDIKEEDSNDCPLKEKEPAALIETITVEDSNDEVVAAASDSDSAEKAEKNKEKIEVPKCKELKSEISPAKKKNKRDYIIRPRRQRPHQDYVKRRVRKSILRSSLSANLKERRGKALSHKLDEYDDVSFDYTYFSELPNDEKCLYLAMRSVAIHDGTEGSFKKDSYKIYFVQHCDTYVYRKNCLTRSKQIHQQVSEIKTSNFDSWHRIWLDRYVTSSMVKFCSDWLFRSEPGKYKVVNVTVTNCAKPPYIPYSKYRIRYYKTET